MRPPRQLALAAAIATLLATGPVLAATALAADPTVVVQPGDTLTGIARRSGVSVRRLVELNRLADPNRIFVGQRLRTGRKQATAPAGPPSRTIHVVSRGSTLWHIARHYGVSVSSIVAANRLTDAGRIFTGQRLIIPAGAAAAPAPSRPSAGSGGSGGSTRPSADRVHVVARGEHLTGIARRYGVTVAAIVRANGIADPSRIFAGQRLTIRGGSGGSAPSSRTAEPGTIPAAWARIMAQRDAVRRIIVHEAAAAGVPRDLALAVAWQESGWRQGVVSHAGAVGVMQLMPGTADWIGESMLGRPVRIHDTRSNIVAGVRLLRHYMDRYHGNRDYVLAAYYQGQRAVDRHGIYRVSRSYIASVRSLERLFRRN